MLVFTWIFDDVLTISERCRRSSDHFRTLSEMSEDYRRMWEMAHGFLNTISTTVQTPVLQFDRSFLVEIQSTLHVWFGCYFRNLVIYTLWRCAHTEAGGLPCLTNWGDKSRKPLYCSMDKFLWPDERINKSKTKSDSLQQDCRQGTCLRYTIL